MHSPKKKIGKVIRVYPFFFPFTFFVHKKKNDPVFHLGWDSASG